MKEYRLTAYMCDQCGRVEHCTHPTRKWHWKLFGEKCFGNWIEGELVWFPNSVVTENTSKEGV